MIFDLTVATVVILLGLSGFRDGLIRGLVKLAGFILTIILMAVYAPEIAALGQLIPNIPQRFAVPTAFVAVFTAAVIGFHVLSVVLSKIIALTPVKFLDCGLGTAFGALKAVFLCGLLALALSYAPVDSPFFQEYQSSQLARPLHAMVLQSLPLLKSAARAVYDRVAPPAEEFILPKKTNDQLDSFI